MTNRKATFVTPKGVTRYTWLNNPDTAFGGEKYKVQLSMDDSSELLEKIKSFGADVFGKKKFRIPTEQDEDGKTWFKFSTKHAPKFNNSRGEYIHPEHAPNVWNDSTIKISGVMTSYDTFGGGVTLNINAVQILQLAVKNDFADEGDSYIGTPSQEESFKDETQSGDF